MEEGTVIGFDFGLRHIGVAVGETVTGTARPLSSLKACGGQPVWQEIQVLMTHWHPTAFMVGIPLSLHGEEQKITQAARQFAEALSQRYGLPVYKIDERFTTLEAKSHLFERKGARALSKRNIDAWSAKIITESGLSQIKRK